MDVCMTKGRNITVQQKNRIWDGVLFGGMLLAVSAVTLYLFYRQCTGSPEQYHSDMKAYILEMQGLESGYSFPYPIFFKLSAFFHLFVSPQWAVAIATMVLNSGAMVVTKLALNRMLLPDRATKCKAVSVQEVAENKAVSVQEGAGTDRGSLVYRAVISGVSISLFFISMLYTPAGMYLPGIRFKYLGVFTPNPFHNATYMAARPFAILAFLWFVKLLPVYEEGVKKGEHANLWDYIWFSITLLLATMTKPSFTLAMVSTAGLVMLFRMIRSKFANFIPTIQLGVCFAPTFIDLLYQYKGVFVATEPSEGGVGFGFGDVWSLYCNCIPLAVCLAVGFPILVLVLNCKRYQKSSLPLFSWQLFAVSFLEALLLFEKGFRKPDFNFSWGYMYGIFFCHFGALVVLLKATAEALQCCKEAGQVTRQATVRSSKRQWLLLGVQWMAYLAHLICGLLYFKDFLLGRMYY